MAADMWHSAETGGMHRELKHPLNHPISKVGDSTKRLYAFPRLGSRRTGCAPRVNAVRNVVPDIVPDLIPRVSDRLISHTEGKPSIQMRVYMRSQRSLFVLPVHQVSSFFLLKSGTLFSPVTVFTGSVLFLLCSFSSPFNIYFCYQYPRINQWRS